MFKKYLAYYYYQKSVRDWASEAGYQDDDIEWILPWSDPAKTSTKSVVVVFDRDLEIKGYSEIFKSNRLAILEKTPEHPNKVRFGIPKQLHHELLQYVRLVATSHFTDATPPEIKAVVSKQFHSYVDDSYTVDVGVWVDGLLRGSRINDSRRDENAIYEATVRAVNDSRFKVMTTSELDQAIFEITIVPNIWIFLEETSLRQKAPYSKSVQCIQNGTMRSIFVPMIANQAKLPSLGEYLRALVKKGQVATFKGIGFIQAPAYTAVETPSRQALVLQGPYPRDVSTAVTAETVATLKNHILKNIDESGFVRIVKPADATESMSADLTRNSLTLYTLSEYYALTKDEEVLEVAHRMLPMQLRLVEKADSMGKAAVCKVYLNQAVVSLEKLDYTPLTDEEVRAATAMTLTKVQYLKQKMMDPELSARGAEECLEETVTVYEQWKQAPDALSPVEYADLPTLLKFSNLHAETTEYLEWLRTKQSDNGSVAGYVAYPRGLGKIAEGCAAIEEGHDIAKKCMILIRQLQHTDETMYHIPKQLREYFRGGFRHDVWNRDLWIDGSDHVLLAELRLAKFSSYTTHLQTCLSRYTSLLPKSDS